MENKHQAQYVAKYGMLIALAFIFSYIEAMIPLPLPIPGMKLGLANLVTMIGLYTIGIKGTVAVSLVRILLVGFTFGNPFSMVYSLAGGLLSLIVMVGGKSSKWFGTVGVSILGGIAHNLGQLGIAAWVTKTMGVFLYLPALLVAGVVAGGVIGLLGGMIVTRVERIVKKTGV